MNNPTRYSLFVCAALALASPLAQARPIDFKELSLLVRAHESEASIRDEAANRKLMQPLTKDQEATLKAQGASDSLITQLRASGVASKEEVALAERTANRAPAAPAGDAMPMHHHGPSVHVFNVAFGHPINLSAWGGSDYEIVLDSYRFAGENHVQAAFVDQFGTRTVVSRTLPLLSEGEAVSQDWFPSNSVRNWRYTPYDVRGDVRDNRFNFSDSVAISSYAVGRPTRIDWDNPVFIKGQPYTFYPVYGAGDVSLYYIGRASDSSATVAVVNYRH